MIPPKSVMLPRTLEPELMDTPEEARDYDAMDHRAVNERFVSDFLAAIGAELGEGEILDLGTGTALIPIELCRRHEECRVTAVDLAIQMLELARYNLEVFSQTSRIQLQLIDAKELPFESGRFAAVMSNSIVHHIPSPADVVAEMVRVTAPGGVLFVRDLLRPASGADVAQLVSLHAAGANAHQRALFDASLRAALTLAEVRAIVTSLGFDATTATQTSDRHWTWSTAMRR